MEKYVVTITRQFGSLGRPIAKELSHLLNIEYYDRDIVDKTAKNVNLPVSVVSDAEEAAKSSFFSMKFPLGLGTTGMQEQIFQTQRKIILDLASKESCIIVGRCSDFILKDHPNHISVYIHAPYEDRLRNCIENLKMDENEAKKMIHEVDAARDSYHMHYAKYLPSDYKHKDLIINSSLLGVEGTAKYLAQLVLEKFALAK
ncbi:MAG: AAA family ATPase [Lachnospiraceae bacterium]